MASVEEISRLTQRELRLIASNRAPESVMNEPNKVAAVIETSARLTQLAVPHALIGGVAVGLHSGIPRATLDTDFAVDSRADRSALVQAFIQAGYRLMGEHAHSLNFRHSSSEPVQLAFDEGFDPMIERAESFQLQQHRIPIVRKVDLIAMKERAASDPGRRRSKALRDQADVALLRGDVPDPDEGW
jgi:hypothetical protein